MVSKLYSRFDEWLDGTNILIKIEFQNHKNMSELFYLSINIKYYIIDVSVLYGWVNWTKIAFFTVVCSISLQYAAEATYFKDSLLYESLYYNHI